MVTRTRLNISLYVHCLSCLSLERTTSQFHPRAAIWLHNAVLKVVLDREHSPAAIVFTRYSNETKNLMVID